MNSSRNQIPAGRWMQSGDTSSRATQPRIDTGRDLPYLEDEMNGTHRTITTIADAWARYIELCGEGEPSITRDDLHHRRTSDPAAPAYGADWDGWLGRVYDECENGA